MSTGYTRMRLSVVLIALSTFVFVFQMFNLGYLAPKAEKYSIEHFQKAIGSGKRALGNDRFWIKSMNYIGSFSFYDAKNRTLYNPEFYFYNDQFKMTEMVRAKYAYHQETMEKQSKWKMTEVVQMTGLDILEFPEEKLKQDLFINLKEGPQELDNFQSDIYSLTLFRFYRFVSSIKESGINLTDYYFYFYDKWAHGLFCLIFALFPWMITKDYNQRHRGTGKVILYGLGFSLGAFGVYMIQSKLLLQAGLPSIYATLLLPVIWFSYSFRRSVRI
jgi:lipopolysaccharide export LptBFGC system permease protein LptF